MNSLKALALLGLAVLLSLTTVTASLAASSHSAPAVDARLAQVGKLKSYQKISSQQGDLGNVLHDGSRFGSAVVSLGDLNGDRNGDIAVGAPGTTMEDNRQHQGTVWVLLLKNNGKVAAKREITAAAAGFTSQDTYSHFGSALANVGDLDGDGVTDLAVGTPFANAGGPGRGAVSILFLNNDGTVKGQRMISSASGDLGSDLDDDDFFGSALAMLGDLDGNGLRELAVGAPGDDDGGEDSSRGAIWILSLRPDGSVAARHKISATSGGFGGRLEEFDQLGQSMTSLGDVNGDGVTDMAAGVLRLDDAESQGQGALWILFLNADGSIKMQQEIAELSGRFGPGPSAGARYGSALAGIGDANGDGIPDLAVGAHGHKDDIKKRNQGAVWILSLSRDGLVQQAERLTTKTDKLREELNSDEQFSWSLARQVDPKNKNKLSLIIGAPGDHDGGMQRGAVWLASLK